MSLHNQELKTMHIPRGGGVHISFSFWKNTWEHCVISPPHKYSFLLILQSERGEKEDAKKKMEEGGEFLKIGRTQCEDSVVLMDREGSVAGEERVWLAANSSSYGGCALV